MIELLAPMTSNNGDFTSNLNSCCTMTAQVPSAALPDPESWKRKNFCLDIMEVIDVPFKKGKRYGPFFRVDNQREFIKLNSDQERAEQGHWFVPTRPTSSSVARIMLALPISNTAKFIREVYLLPGNDACVGFAGVPQINNVAGTVIVLNFNNSCMEFVEEANAWDLL